ncbi:MAG: tetraacyldisaccharide 4'-kinase [Bacteroidetes bacterium]|nr:tetraacyldisaccharide 4'-kinase [Bacteroidota bacterium]
MQFLRQILRPFGWLYGGVMEVRNFLFRKGILKSVGFDIPVICVGNLSVGGTGKTPMVKALITHLSPNLKVAVLSRGYGRKTKGYRNVEVNDNAGNSGDEPLEIKRAFPELTVCVCEDRVLGIAELLHDFPETELIVLDDAFQHQYVKPSVTFLLTKAHKPFYRDFVMPAGRLREFRWNYKRADAIIFTSAPDSFKPDYPLEKPWFVSHIKYRGLRQVWGSGEYQSGGILITGIADASGLAEYAKQHWEISNHINKGDHHTYFKNEVQNMVQSFPDKCWITTEKDWVKLETLLQEINSNANVFVVETEVDPGDQFWIFLDEKV